jgi:hypothetical protein
MREDAPRPVSMLVLSVRANYGKRLTGTGTFTCEDVPTIRAAIEQAATCDAPQVVSARSIGRSAEGDTVAEFVVDWSFKRRSAR